MSPVEDYLDEIFNRLGTTGSAGRRLLTETEDHLREATAAGVADGLSVAEAERRALQQFGSPRTVARQLRRLAARTTTRRRLVRGSAVLVLLLVAVVVARVEYFVHVQAPRQVTGLENTRLGQPVAVGLVADQQPTLAQSLLLEYDCSAGKTFRQSISAASLRCEEQYQTQPFPARTYRDLNRCLQRNGAAGQVIPARTGAELGAGRGPSGLVIHTDLEGSSTLKDAAVAAPSIASLRGFTPAMVPALGQCTTVT